MRTVNGGALVASLILLGAGTPAFAAGGLLDDPHSSTFVWTVIIFIVTWAALTKLGWKPITEGLRAREERIRQAVASAEKLHHDAQELLARYQKLTDEACGEAQAIIAEGQADAQRLGAKLLAETQREVEAQQARALTEIDQAKNTALAELQRTTVDLSLRIASKLIERELNGEDHERLAASCVNEYAQAADWSRSSSSTIHA